MRHLVFPNKKLDHDLTFISFYNRPFRRETEKVVSYMRIVNVYICKALNSSGGGGGLTCICRDTGMCHYVGYFFWAAPGFLGTFLGYSRIFGYHFLAISGFLGIILFWENLISSRII